MIRELFDSQRAISRMESSPLCPQLNSLAAAMKKKRYGRQTMSKYLSICQVFGIWLAKKKIPLNAVTDRTIEQFLACPAKSVGSRDKKWKTHAGPALHAFFRHLREIEFVDSVKDGDTDIDDVGKCLVDYGHHLDKVRGLILGTCKPYLRYAERLLRTQSVNGSIDWSTITVHTVAEFVRCEASNRKGFGTQHPAIAVRSFVRFLILQNILPAGMEAAIPTIKRWSQSALPQRLSEDELKSLLEYGKADVTSIGKRNYAIILLLARLALRAGEVIRLQLDDLDWSNGQLIVRASKRRERLLPLTQEVADALLEYLQHSRPTTTYREIFLWHTAPFVPLQCASAITYVVQCLLKKAGIKRETSGAHLLRHTVASHMVNNGVSFKDTADFLGHRFLQTTSIYAKLDLAALSEVAMPWPGGAQ